MSQQKWGMVGIGKLGGALVTQLSKLEIAIGFYHSNENKRNAFHAQYPLTQPLQQQELSELDFLVLALPAHQVAAFVSQMIDSGVSLTKPVLINMATSCFTNDLRAKFPGLKWMPMKLMGHAAHLMEQGNGLFVTEENLLEQQHYQEAARYFSRLGKVVTDQEDVLEQVNKLAAYCAIKAAKEFEQKMAAAEFPTIYQDRAFAAIFPTLIKSYTKGQLGHFAQQIADQVERELAAKS